MNDWEAGTSGAVVTEDFDVFLNHRGSDVKATFVAHLEDALRCAGYRPFLDVQSLMKGNPALHSIDQALAMAKVHVAVLSTNYAASKYCLDELVAMVRSGKPVVPVFYGVEPVDSRWVENGPFAEAFEKHKSKGRSETKMQEWREALAALAGITGFRLADYRSDESKLKREVVNQVARLTPSHIPVEVDSCRVGLEGPARSCIQVLEEMGGGIGILGLVGMGGIGKTTLTREVYNYFAAQTKFRHMSFLEIHQDDNPTSSSNVQVRRTWSKELRKQLLWDLLRVETSGSTDYSNWFRKVSIIGPVMIAVDNVHNLEQFKALIPFAANLHPGSRIILTSRDRSILNNVGGRARVDHSIFEVALLDSHDSSMLFNWHAFDSKEAPEDFRNLAKDVVATCGGLPLALKVIGSSLFDKRSGRDRKTIWLEAGDAMRQSRDVMDVLRWSYDMLPEADQRMFVDITCLFNNKSTDEALSFWRSCKDCPSCTGMDTPHTSLQNLIDKNLVSYDEWAYLKVHDLLVELGEEIGKLTKTHFTKGNIGEAALTRKEGSTKTMALNLRESRKQKFEVGEFANMSNLHFLELPNGGVMNGDWRYMPKELRWLRWRNTSLTHVPANLDLSHLISLDFSRSSTLVALWNKSKCGLTGCPHLVRLKLKDCTSITKLPYSIGQSSQLQKLNLWGCTNLKELPDSIGQLKELHTLDLGLCSRLKALPNSIGQVLRLQRLNLYQCMMLERLPESIRLLKELEYLNVFSCASLKTLSDSIGGLSSLEWISAKHCTSRTTLPPPIQHCFICKLRMHQIFSAGCTGEALMRAGCTGGDFMKDLTYLQLENSHGLAAYLRSQNFHGLAAHLRMQDFHSLPASLRLQNSHRLTASLLADVFKSLDHLVLKDKTVIEFPESIGLLVTIKILDIECERLQCLPNSLGNLKRLKKLKLERCENLKRLPKTLGALTNLEVLIIMDCGLLRKLPSSIGILSRLRLLDIYGCKKI